MQTFWPLEIRQFVLTLIVSLLKQLFRYPRSIAPILWISLPISIQSIGAIDGGTEKSSNLTSINQTMNVNIPLDKKAHTGFHLEYAHLA